MIGFQFCEKCAKSWQKTSLWHSMEPIAFTDLICSLEASNQQWRVSIRLVMHTAAKKKFENEDASEASFRVPCSLKKYFYPFLMGHVYPFQ